MQTIRDPLRSFANSPLCYFLIYVYNDRIFPREVFPFVSRGEKIKLRFAPGTISKTISSVIFLPAAFDSTFPSAKVSPKNFGYMRKKVGTLLQVHVTGQIIFRGKKTVGVEKRERFQSNFNRIAYIFRTSHETDQS